MSGKEFQVKRFSELPSDIRSKYAPRANYRVNGDEGNWDEIMDYPYGYGVRHVAILGEDGEIIFDKLNIIQRGVFIVPIRVNPKGLAEVFIQRETRFLLRGPNGEQGSSVVENIPQGAVNIGEPEGEAARREVIEETGYKPSALAIIGRVGFDIPNSESLFNFYLALVPYQVNRLDPKLDENEVIDRGHWYSFKEAAKRQFIDGKTIIGLALAEKVIQQRYIR